MKNSIKALFGRRGKARNAEFDAPIAPDAPFVVVGDIHGCADLLNRLIERLEAEDGDKTWVFLGDFVDRGPATAQVLARLRALEAARPGRVICLKGNHERMMQDFIDDPLGRGARWLAFGGLETLKSFGIATGNGKTHPTGDAALELAEALERVIPEGLETWVRELPLSWRSGNMACVHAAMDPMVAFEKQREQDLLWGHGAFMREPREDGLWVAHGHTVVKTAEMAGGRIAVDTGAYQTGRLSGARISSGGCEFITA
ncbi:metallophosphoesterase family protein [Aquicoccus sp. G2-2]|uniref:metallophosphoesterase family protein n=1 Tax=Aquicoccus sp. G2-2 TaxID=3092120 RepID=UPI002ADF8BBA|nr:metallophosphoesterase family protein [Aquicoccus sp. G2-2]MEA1115087.1 metallophosphoesterase family protein [Aquicoccus sp. G2-2]